MVAILSNAVGHLFFSILLTTGQVLRLRHNPAMRDLLEVDVVRTALSSSNELAENWLFSKSQQSVAAAAQWYKRN